MSLYLIKTRLNFTFNFLDQKNPESKYNCKNELIYIGEHGPRGCRWSLLHDKTWMFLPSDSLVIASERCLTLIGWASARTQSLFICFWGERRLGVTLRRGRCNTVTWLASSYVWKQHRTNNEPQNSVIKWSWIEPMCTQEKQQQGQVYVSKIFFFII